jgi:alpha-mannosidase
MCGCNDENAEPGKMGENGKEGDGGCDCSGLTMRGRHLIIFDTHERANAARRWANEELQSPATIGINVGTGTPTRPSYSAISEALPLNVKLQTVMSNYDTLFEGKLVLRLAHLFAIDEHTVYSKPATVSLAAVFAKTGFKVTSVEEMSLTATMTLAEMDAAKIKWPTHDVTNGKMWHTSDNVTSRTLMVKDDPTLTVTLRPMELRTLLVTIE